MTGMREFGTRTSFRPRPLDINRQLPIVRDLSELDSTEGLVSREITHNHEALDKENEEVRALNPLERGIWLPQCSSSAPQCVSSPSCVSHGIAVGCSIVQIRTHRSEALSLANKASIRLKGAAEDP